MPKNMKRTTRTLDTEMSILTRAGNFTPLFTNKLPLFPIGSRICLDAEKTSLKRTQKNPIIIGLYFLSVGRA